MTSTFASMDRVTASHNQVEHPVPRPPDPAELTRVTAITADVMSRVLRDPCSAVRAEVEGIHLAALRTALHRGVTAALDTSSRQPPPLTGPDGACYHGEALRRLRAHLAAAISHADSGTRHGGPA